RDGVERALLGLAPAGRLLALAAGDGRLGHGVRAGVLLGRQFQTASPPLISGRSRPGVKSSRPGHPRRAGSRATPRGWRQRPPRADAPTRLLLPSHPPPATPRSV